MKNIIYKTSILFASFLPCFSYAQADLSNNLIDCKLKSSGAWGGCSVANIELLPSASYERSAKVSYKFECSPGGQNRFPIGISFGGNTSRLLFGGEGEVTVDGTGKLLLTNSDPDAFYGSVFKPGCSLKIRSVDVHTSANQITSWQSTKAAQMNELISAETARDGFTELVGYKKVFVVLDTLHQSLLNNIGLSKETRAMLAPGSELTTLMQTLLTQTVTLDDPDTDIKETTALSTAEKMPLLRILQVISAMPADAECDAVTTDDCEKVKLSKYLSTEDADQLGKVAAYKLTAEKAQEAQTRFTAIVKEKEEQLVSLCSYARSSGADLVWTAEEAARFCMP